MEQKLFDLLETLNIVALIPCLFAILMLLVVSHRSLLLLLPILFLGSLAASALATLLPLMHTSWHRLLPLLIGYETMQPALCFLFIIQLVRNALPPLIYWFILALPLLGGGSLLYALHQLEEACVLQTYCLPSAAFGALYQLFATSTIFLLLLAHLSHIEQMAECRKPHQAIRYWLIIALVLSFLMLLLFELAFVAGAITHEQNQLVHVLTRLVFLYLITTSLLRLFDKQTGLQQDGSTKAIDPALISSIETAMQQQQLYREMGFSREKCAQHLQMPEHVLSRTINQAFGKNFNEYVNSYRVEEAKQRLRSEKTSITAIAFEVGFSSIASFNRVFKSMVGCSPTQYRAKPE